MITILVFLILAFIILWCYYLLLRKEERRLDKEIVNERFRLALLNRELKKCIEEMDNERLH